jgi:hypothetical protein
MKLFATTESNASMQTGKAGKTSPVSTPISAVESVYQQRIAAMTPAQRVARSAALFEWTRDQIARQIVAEHGDMDSETLRWQVALRLYGNEPILRHLIERKLSDVPG